jgi:hypothetical protein
MQLTEDERSLLVAIRDSDFHFGNPPVDSRIWVDGLPGWSHTRKFSSTMFSLVEKRLVGTNYVSC